MINPVLSDLFFNHEHPARDKLFDGAPGGRKEAPLIDPAEMTAALKQDAAEFLTSYSSIFSCEVPSPTELAADFFGRV